MHPILHESLAHERHAELMRRAAIDALAADGRRSFRVAHAVTVLGAVAARVGAWFARRRSAARVTAVA
jgi:hypothetical protein